MPIRYSPLPRGALVCVFVHVAIIITIIIIIIIIIIMRGSNLLAQTWLRRARARGRMPGVPSPRLASTAGCRLRGLPVGKACLGGVPVQAVVEAGFFKSRWWRQPGSPYLRCTVWW
jgi:hypothetical protein